MIFKSLNKNFLNSLIFLIIIFLLDRISKEYIIFLDEKNFNSEIFSSSFLNIVLVWNSGIGFGLLSFEKQFLYNFITLIIILVNFVILYLGIKSNNFKGFLFFIILGGSLGNLFDRLYYSAVPDFIDVNYNGFHWFIFNVADIFISVGIICLIFAELFFNKKEKLNEM